MSKQASMAAFARHFPHRSAAVLAALWALQQSINSRSAS
jgi:hypothetical protein